MMRARTAAIAATLSLFSIASSLYAIPASADPSDGGAYAQNDDNGQDAGGGYRRRSTLSGCASDYEDGRSFRLQTGDRIVPVVLSADARRDFDGHNPDTALRRGAAVVVSGRFGRNGVFHADDIRRNRDADDADCGYAHRPYRGAPYPGSPYPRPLPGTPATTGLPRVIFGTVLSVGAGSFVFRSSAGNDITANYYSSTAIVDVNSNPVSAQRLAPGEAITVAGIVPSPGVIDARTIRIRSNANTYRY